MAKPKKAKKPMSKGKKIAIISISGALLIGGGVVAGIYSNQIISTVKSWCWWLDNGSKMANVASEYQVEKGVVIEEGQAGVPYKYLGSGQATVNLVGDDGKEEPTSVCAHTFLIGRVSSVPFYESGWTKFDYENIGMKISYSKITASSVSEKLSTTNERVESTSWSSSSHFQQKFVASAEGKIGPVKLKAENTIDYQVDKSRSGTSMNRYVSSSEQTNTSIETLSKTADYSIQLNSSNGFKRGKYYRMTLQQTASMYMVIYEKSETGETSKINADTPNDKFYELESFLADPNDYTMVIEETDDPAIEPEKPEGERFDPALYDQCAQWIEDVRSGASSEKFTWVYTDDHDPETKTREDQLKEYFGEGKTSVTSAPYVRASEWRITDAGRNKNPSDKVTFPTLFKDKCSPTFGELFNTTEAGGFGYKYVDISMEYDLREYDDGHQDVFLVDRNKDVINTWSTDLDKSWHNRLRCTYEGLDAWDKLSTSIVPELADGWIHFMYDGHGYGDDDWGIRNFTLIVTIRKA